VIALFVALGGPAEAQRLISGRDIKRNSVTGAQIRDGSLGTRELSASARRGLRDTPSRIRSRNLANGAVTSGKLAAGAVTGGKLAAGAVTSATIADGALGAIDLGAGSVGAGALGPNSVNGSKVADGTLRARDVARFWGIADLDFAPIGAGACGAMAVTPQGGVDISQDLVVAYPARDWPADRLTYSVRGGGGADQFAVVACNRTLLPTDPAPVRFRYAVIGFF